MSGWIIAGLVIFIIFNIFTTITICVQLMEIKNNITVDVETKKIERLEKLIIFYKNNLINEEEYKKLLGRLIEENDSNKKDNEEENSEN